MSKLKLKTCQFCGEQINKKQLAAHIEHHHALDHDDYDDRLEAKRKDKHSTLMIKRQKVQGLDSHPF